MTAKFPERKPVKEFFFDSDAVKLTQHYIIECFPTESAVFFKRDILQNTFKCVYKGNI